MAQAPKCKVCGSSHFGGAHVWPTAVWPTALASSRRDKGMSVATEGVLSVVPDERDLQIAELKAQVAELKACVAAGRPVPKTADRAAYMREWRAKRKAAR